MNLLYSLSLLAAFTSQASAFAPTSLASQRSNVSPTFLIMSTVDTFTLPTVKNVKEEFKTSQFNTMLQCRSYL